MPKAPVSPTHHWVVSMAILTRLLTKTSGSRPAHSEAIMSSVYSSPIVTTRRGVLGLAAAALSGAEARSASADGQITIASHVSLAPTWFDPAETAGIITPF